MAEFDRFRILLVGSGGREHTLAWKLSQSERVDKIYVVPGNGGTARGLRKVENICTVKPDDFQGLVAFAQENNINFVVPGPEAPLVAGIATHFRKADIKCFGPSEEAAHMEGSKTFAKDFMARWHIPTAEYKNFAEYEPAKSYLDKVSHKVVLKASGLAAGKGVIMPASQEEAHSALRNIMLTKEFGAAGNEVVIEEYLEGEELSFLSFSDGYTLRSLPPAQDHKQIYDGDNGPNTGGMGCYGPAPIATEQLIEEVHRTILEPTIRGMRREGYPFIGLLFTGIMVTKNGPKTLEYNVRFGDPECQTLIPLLSSDTDLAEIMLACTKMGLDNVHMHVQEEKFSATIVAAAGGYPGAYVRGDAIAIDALPPDVASTEGVIFHAGTHFDKESLKTAGGRVIAATSIAASLEDAISAAYEVMSTIHFKDMHYRRDIGQKGLLRQRSQQASKPDRRKQALSYADAGVSVSSGNELIKRIKPILASTARPGAAAEIGGFGGVLQLSAAGYPGPNLVGATDGVGTKLLIAQAMKKHDTIGIDCVAMNVNDLVVQGAEPLMFLDVYSCGKLDNDVAEQVVKGIAAGCIEAGCALVGGETAEMPGLFAAEDGKYDISGTAIGAIATGTRLLPDKAAMKVGDVLLGLASSGCHSNGFSLIRKIVQERTGVNLNDKAPWPSSETLGECLLTPTRIYVKPVLAAVQKDLIKGMAHITGGGLIENVPRMLPKQLAAVLDAASWKVPEVLKWVKKCGNMTEAEFATTFNTGLGMILVVAKDNMSQTLEELQSAGETVWEVGRLTERTAEGCVIENMDSWT